ncbi:MAG TPA: hypothetical protein VK013_09170 [Myxococcaceae bacterium]|nr:hypothetical protein [Myxococcaceae bacterium]
MRTRFLKTVLLLLLSGVILGAVVASLIAPALYTWSHAPGAGTQEIVSRVEVIREATSMLLRAQTLGAGIGGLTGLIAGILFARSRSRREARRLQAPVNGSEIASPTNTSAGV